MWNLIKKYWDLFGGFILGIAITIIGEFKIGIIQLAYSIIVLFLVCIGLLRVVKIAIAKKPKKNKNTIEKMVDSRKEMKAIAIAQNPLKQGEELYETLKESKKVGRKLMKKIKIFFDKFKGYILTISLAILTLISQYGDVVDKIFDGKLVVNGVNILTIITLVLTVITGLLSNAFTKDQILKIKDLFKSISSSEVESNIVKEKLKTNEEILKKDKKDLEFKNSELETLQSDLERKKNTYNVYVSLLNQNLSTQDEVSIALTNVQDIENKVVAKNREIINLENKININTTNINALKSRLGGNN